MAPASTLYLTRKYPPSVGGMEAYAASVAAALRDLGSTEVISLGRRQQHLAWWLPTAAAKLTTRRRRAATRVVCGDPVVLLALWPMLARSPASTSVIVHGLDLTWTPGPYQSLLRRSLPKVDHVIAISRYTAELAVSHGAKADAVAVVRPAVPPPPPTDRAAARRQLAAAAGVDAAAPILATLGRLVPRKGVRWFVEQVLPSVPAASYLVAGQGPDGDAIRAAAGSAGVAGRVRLLGAVDETLKEAVLAGPDLFVMPNISVPGDVEGFGIVAAEAAVRGTPVLGAATEGIPDALDDGAAGWLAPPGDAPRWADRISELLADRVELSADGARFALHAGRNFSATRFAADLRQALQPG
jgi:phosphatidylinositol alpha-1,6-mannosyltransferase